MRRDSPAATVCREHGDTLGPAVDRGGDHACNVTGTSAQRHGATLARGVGAEEHLVCRIDDVDPYVAAGGTDRGEQRDDTEPDLHDANLACALARGRGDRDGGLVGGRVVADLRQRQAVSPRNTPPILITLDEVRRAPRADDGIPVGIRQHHRDAVEGRERTGQIGLGGCRNVERPRPVEAFLERRDIRAHDTEGLRARAAQAGRADDLGREGDEPRQPRAAVDLLRHGDERPLRRVGDVGIALVRDLQVEEPLGGRAEQQHGDGAPDSGADDEAAMERRCRAYLNGGEERKARHRGSAGGANSVLERSIGRCGRAARLNALHQALNCSKRPTSIRSRPARAAPRSERRAAT